MNDHDKTKAQLISELAELRERLAAVNRKPDRPRTPDDCLVPTTSSWHSLLANTYLFILIFDRDHRIRVMNHPEPTETPEQVIGKTPWCDANGALIDFNRCWYEYTGQTAVDAEGQGWMKALHPDDSLRVAEQVKKAIADGDPYQTEYRLRRASDGSYRWHLARVVPMKDNDGKITGWFGSATDIHDQKEMQTELQQQVKARTHEVTAANQQLQREIEERRCAEESLQQSERRFRNYFEQSLIGMATTSPAKGWLDVNDRLCEILGYPRRELLTKTWAEITHPDDLAKDDHHLRRLMAGELDHYTTDKRYIRKDGTTVYTTIMARPFRNDAGAVDHFVGLMVDITERKQAEESLYQSHEQLQAIYDGIIEGLLITDIETKRIRRVNSSFCRMLGYCEEELLTKSIPDLHPAEEVPNDLQRFQAAAEGRVWINEDRPVLRKDGSVFYSDITGHRIVFEDRPCLLALFRDVTERRQAQDALLHEQRTLLRMLRASDHERQTIAYDIHDGLAQHLAAAIMQFQAYECMKNQNTSEARATYASGVTIVQRALAEARRLISGVRPPVLDESGVVVAIAHLVHETRKHGGPQIEYHHDVESGRFAPIFENAVYRIAQEAIANAYQHSRSEKVKVSLVQEGDQLHLEVQDWGVGFDCETASENCFGLEGIKERTRLLDGSLDVASELGKGTCVRVTLPILKSH